MTLSLDGFWLNTLVVCGSLYLLVLAIKVLWHEEDEPMEHGDQGGMPFFMVVPREGEKPTPPQDRGYL